MKLSKLAAKPTLTLVVLDDEKIVETYGEPIEFYVYDRQDMTTFMKLASLEGEQDFGAIASVVEDLVLDEDGNKVLGNGNMLPVDVMLKVIETTVRQLGNAVSQTSVTLQAS